MKRMLLNTGLILLIILTGFAGLLYFFQERLIFFPDKLPAGYRFRFSQPFQEIVIRTADNTTLSTVLFKAPSSKGVIFYLHGNAGSVDSWGDVATVYTDLNYDVFMMDYRGYGKSEGHINGERQLYEDVQLAYNKLKSSYDESKIVVLGYSIGTGVAARVAALNNPRLLILQAPFYNFSDLIKKIYPFVPPFLSKYKFRTDKLIQQCKMPVVIFHGDRDEIIYHGSSVKLARLFKKGDRLIILKGEGHNGMSSNPQYLDELRTILR
jgi:uncharacterized protein